MARCLLFFPILRTRSARKTLLTGSVIVLLASNAGCDDDTPSWHELTSRFGPGSPDKANESREPRPDKLAETRQEAARQAAQELAALQAEAGVDDGQDPPAPSGDLKRDLADFTTLEACVRSHRVTDAILADAVDALGYDTLVRDACRTLQALKSKDIKHCRPISAAPLRLRCESQLAIFTGEPALCPLVAGSGAVQVREPVCMARASRDERFCAAALGNERATCQALVRGRASDCGTDVACARQVERLGPLLEKPASHAPFPARLHVAFADESSKVERFDGAFDLDELAAAGAVARSVGDKVRFLIGTPKNVSWPAWDSPAASPRLFLAVSVPTKPRNAPLDREDGGREVALGPADLSLELLIPQIALLDSTLASDRRVTIDTAAATTSSPLKLTLTTKVRDTTRTFRVTVELETFVRDGITPRGAK